MTNHNLAPRSADMPSSNMSTAEIFALFGKKPVLATENPAEYDALRESILAEVRPRDLFEHFHTRRYLDLTWEGMRYQRCAGATIEMTSRAAVAAIVDEFASDGLNGRTPEELIEGWFSDLDIRMELLGSLARYGVNEESVMAQAMAMRSVELGRISEIRTRAEVQAAAHMREIERRRELTWRSLAQLNGPASGTEAESRPAA